MTSSSQSSEPSGPCEPQPSLLCKPAEQANESRLGHLLFAGVSALVFVLAMSLHINARGQVCWPSTDSPLPESCWLRRTTGIPCAGCGLTRSFVSLAHGAIFAAFRYNPMGPVLFAIVVFQIPWRMVQLHRLSAGKLPLRIQGVGIGAVVIMAALMLQWIMRLTLLNTSWSY